MKTVKPSFWLPWLVLTSAAIAAFTGPERMEQEYRFSTGKPTLN